MKKNITKEELAHIAELSKLNLQSSQDKDLLCDLAQMLDFASEISDLDISDNQRKRLCLSHISELRDDAVSTPLSREDILSKAPTRNDTYVTIPRIIEE